LGKLERTCITGDTPALLHVELPPFAYLQRCSGEVDPHWRESIKADCTAFEGGHAALAIRKIPANCANERVKAAWKRAHLPRGRATSLDVTTRGQTVNLGIRSIEARRLIGRTPSESIRDDVVVEEPLEIRIAGETLAITMRTPGHDRELVLGFLLSEGVIASTADVLGVTHCGRIGAEGRDNTIDVTLVPGVKPPIDPETGMLTRRGTLMTSACGVCGRRSIDELIASVAPLAHTDHGIERSVLTGAVRSLRDRQPIFGQTGGCHAVSLVDVRGQAIATYEDVGRHNAVDKVVGSRLLAGELPGAGMVLVVSGRASFEIVQKAFSAGIPIIASVSAPSSLAIDLANRANITLAGFVRDETMTVYTSPNRIS